VTFWTIIISFELQELFIDLQGSHNKQQQTYLIQQSNTEKIEKFSFANRLNNIVPLLSDVWLDESGKQMKKTLKTIVLVTVPTKCDI
jgi:hypothetical protein